MKPSIYLIKGLLCFTLVCHTSKTYSQSGISDSLHNIIKQSTGIVKAVNMLALANHLVEDAVYDSTCIFWATEAEKEASRLKDTYSIARAREIRARYYFNKSDWEKSIKSFEATLAVSDKIPKALQKNEMNFKGLMGLAEVYNYMGDYVTALDYRLKGLKLIDSIQTNINERINAYMSIANDFRHLDQRSKAIEYLEQIYDEVPQAKGNHQLDFYYEYYQNLLLDDQIEESKKILKRFDSGVTHFKLSTSQQLEFAGIAQKLHGQFELYHAKNFSAAVAFFKKYLYYSERLDNQTHIAIAYNKIGIACDSLKDYPGAIAAYKQSYEICMREQVIDYGYKSALGLASLYEKTGDFKNAYRFSSAAYTLKEKLDTEMKLRELNMLEAKYQASKKEKEITSLKLANAEHVITDSRQKQSLSNTRFVIVLLVLISVVLLFFVYRYYHKKQLKEIEMRNRISRDLHDDIGATLSSIKIYGELAHTVLDNKPDQSKAMIGKITEQSKDLMQRMGDVIWSLKSAKETNNTFTSRIMNYSSELLAPKGITCEVDIDDAMCSRISNPITRKNILLIIKEAMNNIAKYSGATQTNITFKQTDDKLILSIQDNGAGFNRPESKNGNGLVNMRQRCEQCHGTFTIESVTGKGVAIRAEFPLAIFGYKG